MRYVKTEPLRDYSCPDPIGAHNLSLLTPEMLDALDEYFTKIVPGNPPTEEKLCRLFASDFDFLCRTINCNLIGDEVVPGKEGIMVHGSEYARKRRMGYWESMEGHDKKTLHALQEAFEMLFEDVEGEPTPVNVDNMDASGTETMAAELQKVAAAKKAAESAENTAKEAETEVKKLMAATNDQKPQA